MSMYILKIGNERIVRLSDYEFASEGAHDLSPQMILFDNPDMLLDLKEIGMFGAEIFMAMQEYNTNRGLIDLLLITEKAEIVLVETKLLRNPESTRQVVAQVIDYIKALSEETLDDLIRKIKAKYPDQAARLNKDINFSSLVAENLRTGNFQVLIVGDYIHPNVLGMVNSIHSAPHLSFTIHLVDLNPYVLDGENIIFQPMIVTSSLEIERSVIRIEIEPDKLDYKIQSEIPAKRGKGRKPLLSWDQYLENLSEEKFVPILREFRKQWISEVSDSISMGQVGFSTGLEFDGKRIPIQFVYDNRIPVISERHRRGYDIPKPIYDEYLEEIKTSPYLYDRHIVGGKVEVYFKDIDQDTLELIVNASINLAKKFKQSG